MNEYVPVLGRMARRMPVLFDLYSGVKKKLTYRADSYYL